MHEQLLELDHAVRERVKHIVIVMMENRSFDHMLGYLSKAEWRLGNPDQPETMVTGLGEEEFTETWEGVPYSTYPLGTTVGHGDPAHDGWSVGWQSAEKARYIETYKRKNPANDPREVMGYLTKAEVPVYDFLARNFCVCDRWFCSVPGATWPNRMFAIAATSGGETDIPPTMLEGLVGVRSFFRYLDAAPGDDGTGVSWRWYSSDPSLLRAFDPHYRTDDRTDRFAYFDQYTERQATNFVRDCQDGTLPNVSWVDPNFFRLPGLLDEPLDPDDDHPPHNAILGQKFVHRVYELLRNSNHWDQSLLIVTYDEHGGFYDHVNPPAPFGPRVPTLVVSPWVKPGLPCHEVLEHTSIIKTVLRRFGPEGAIEAMGPRVYYANDVWHMLTETTSREGPPIDVPGAAALVEGDLESRWLKWPGSTVQRVIEVIDKKAEELVELQHELLSIYEDLRRVVPRPLARWISRVARHLPNPLTRFGRWLIRPVLTALPKDKRPMPDRQP